MTRNLISDAILLGLLTWMFWPTAKNLVTRTRGGNGPRHREPGMATPWKRRGRPTTTVPLRRPIPLEMREWTSTRGTSRADWLQMINQRSASSSLFRSVDLVPLCRIADFPLGVIR